MTLSPFDAFRPDAIAEETLTVNAALAAKMAKVTLAADLPSLREQFARGEGPIPAAPPSPRARTLNIRSHDAEIGLRIIAPPSPQGVYLHIHGGAWMLGTNAMWDDQLERIADQANLATVSVDYRLAPEHPYPAAVDDCESAALWLIAHAMDEFGTDRLAIGGESAGAHLSVLTLIRLRERAMQRAFVAANLMYGGFDLARTPSGKSAVTDPVIPAELTANSSVLFRAGIEPMDPRVSPLYADLSDMPPALLTVGSLDPLVDDSVLMHTRWIKFGNASELAVYPGGLHGFTSLGGQLAAVANARADAFLRDAMSGPLPQRVM
ncbi:MAG: alpha/beta hydrolase [Luteibacter sp.]